MENSTKSHQTVETENSPAYGMSVRGGIGGADGIPGFHHKRVFFRLRFRLLLRGSRSEVNVRSAVRLFCFLIGMDFQQIPPLLLLVNLLFVLLLVRGCALDELEGGGGVRFGRIRGRIGGALWTWKPSKNHTILWK